MSETSTESTTETTEAAIEVPDTGADAGKLQAEVDKWKSLSRKHEDRAKANDGAARELEDLRRSQMGEQEKAVDEARKAGRTEAVQELGARLVTAEFRAQAAGKFTDSQLSELLEDADMSKYLTDAGEVDVERVTRKVTALAPSAGTDKTWPDLGQGSRDVQKPAPTDAKSLIAAGLSATTPK